MPKNAGPAASRFTTRYTTEQKQAILRAVLADGHTVSEARKLARTGGLGIPAFEIGVYAYTLVKEGRDQFEARDEDALTRAVANELKGAELDALAAIRTIRQAFKKGGKGSTTALARATRDLANIRKARKETMPNTPTRTKRPAASNEEARETQPTSDATLTNLLDLASQSGNKPVKGRRESGSVSRPPIDDAEDLA